MLIMLHVCEQIDLHISVRELLVVWSIMRIMCIMLNPYAFQYIVVHTVVD